MANPTMKTFLVLYLIPAQVMDDWAKTDPEKRKPAEEKMRNDWRRWMDEHAEMITVTQAAGKTKNVTSAGIADTKNDIILYSLMEAESHETAAKACANHPHLTIPQSSIQVMEIRPLGGPA